MWSMYLFFAHSYVASILETKEKIEENVTMRLKNSFSNHWLMVRLNLSPYDVKNSKETTFVKQRILNLAYKQGVLCEKSKQLDKFTASKTRKSVRKVPKTWSGNEF